MKRPNITPGPWFVTQAANKPVKIETLTCRLICTMADTPEDQREANARARAIAALPALLTALEALHAIGKDGVAMRHETGKPTWSALGETKKLTQAALIQAGYTF